MSASLPTLPTTFLVTGGAGFVGSHLTDALLAQGHTVVVLDDLSTGDRANLAAAWPNPRLRFVRGSALDTRLAAELAGRCEVVVHLATEGERPVVEAARAHGRRLLVASSGEIPGDSSGEVPGDDVTVVRLHDTVGPRQSAASGAVVPRLAAQAVAGLPLTLHGDGTRRLRLTHVADTVDALLRLLAEPAPAGRVLDVSGTQETAVADLAGVLVERSGSPSPLRFVPYEAGARDPYGPERPAPDAGPLRELTGWEPRLGLLDIVDAALVDAGGAFGAVTTVAAGARP